MSRATRSMTLCSVLVFLIATLTQSAVQGRSGAAPPLAAPTGTVVNVSTEAELQAAVRKLVSNTTIVLAPGSYALSRTIALSGALVNIAIRGGADNADEVILTGPGMANAVFGSAPDAITVARGVQGILIANLTVRDFYRHAIVFSAGAASPRLYNVHLVDAGESFVESDGVDNGVVEYSAIEYSKAARSALTGGVHVTNGANWMVRRNLFRNIVAAGSELAGPAVSVSNGSRRAVTEGNTFVNCAQAIAYGVADRGNAADHRGGAIRNNFIYRSSSQPGGAAISLASSPNTKVVNNTAYLSGTYATPIEYRFASTTGVRVANNLVDGFLWARDGATGAEQNNLTGATADMFVNAPAGDLHLATSAAAAIDHADSAADVADDIDGDVRPLGAAQDIGADELVMAAAAVGAPTVAMTAPANGATVSGSAVTVTADATDSGGIAGVQFKLDGANLNAEETEFPYSISWNSTTAANGAHTITAVARDWSGNSTTSAAIGVTVNNASAGAPTVTMTAPSNGATVSGKTVTVTATATDSDGIAGVQFKLDGANLNAEETELPYSISWDSTTATNGVHAITAVARDSKGSSKTSSAISVTVNNSSDTTLPSVSIGAPAAGATVSGSAVSVAATASDNVGVKGVQFKLDGANLGAEDTTSPYSTVWNTTTASSGSHTLSAVARDAAGNTRTSATVTVTVNNGDVTAPAAAISAPASAATVSGSAVTVSATASDNVGVAGVQFKLDGANLGAEDTASPYSTVWNSTAVANGSHTLSAVARDAAGNTRTAAAITVTVSNTASDVTAPAAAISAPASAATVSGSAVTVSATASDNVGVAGVQFKLDGANLGAEDTASPYSTVWNSTTAANGSHTLTAVARDAAGNTKTSTAITVTVSNGGGGGGGGSTPGVNWLDPLKYQKPQFVPLNKPNEATVSNKYWIDLSAGSGSTCSQASPCRSFDDVLGKPGTKGGPAVLYVKGTGGMSWFNDQINGAGDADCRTSACANWILIRTWPAGSPGCATECTATINGNSNMSSPTGVHHIMFDGGPDLKLRFNSNQGADTYANHIIANYVTVYRTQTFCTGANKQLGWSVGDTSVSSHVAFINNEFYGCGSTGDQSSAIYVGPGGGGGYNDLVIQNNIIRDFFGEGIEVNPRVTSSAVSITGNAIHTVGKGTCATSWLCRPGIVMSVQSGGGNNSTVIANNLIWDTGSGCIWDRGAGSPAPVISGNTCYDFGKGSGSGGPNPQGISGYSNGGTATIKNNVIYSPIGVNPFDGSRFNATNNLCASGKSCGSASQVWSAATVMSTNPDTGTFLMIGTVSEARNKGTAMSMSTSYTSTPRPQESSYDIGAFEFTTSAAALVGGEASQFDALPRAERQVGRAVADDHLAAIALEGQALDRRRRSQVENTVDRQLAEAGRVHDGAGSAAAAFEQHGAVEPDALQRGDSGAVGHVAQSVLGAVGMSDRHAERAGPLDDDRADGPLARQTGQQRRSSDRLAHDAERTRRSPFAVA
jgi:hypothetical protein